MARHVPNRGSRPRDGIWCEFNSLGAVRKKLEGGRRARKSKGPAVCQYVGALPYGRVQSTRAPLKSSRTALASVGCLARRPLCNWNQTCPTDSAAGASWCWFLEKNRMTRSLICLAQSRQIKFLFYGGHRSRMNEYPLGVMSPGIPQKRLRYIADLPERRSHELGADWMANIFAKNSVDSGEVRLVQ
jgi:hypothetical protein